jgi:hypothetical protein
MLWEFAKVEELGELTTFKRFPRENDLTTAVANVSLSCNQVSALINKTSSGIFLLLRDTAIKFGEAAHHLVNRKCLSGVAIEGRQLAIIQLRGVKYNLSIGVDETAILILKEALEADGFVFAVD